MTVAATDLRSGPGRIEGGQDVEPRPRRDGFAAVGLVAGILGVLFLLAAILGAASPPDFTTTAGTRSTVPAQVEWINLSPPK
jgi:hypothetical protein